MHHSCSPPSTASICAFSRRSSRGMREIERHGHRRLAVGREPLIRQIKVQREIQSARRELVLQLLDARLDHRAVEPERQVGQAQLEQFLVAQVWPVGRKGFRHRWTVVWPAMSEPVIRRRRIAGESNGAVDRARTCDPQLRRLMLYPTELRPHKSRIMSPFSACRRRPFPASSLFGSATAATYGWPGFLADEVLVIVLGLKELLQRLEGRRRWATRTPSRRSAA